MSTHEHPDRGAFERWREHRRAKRQQALERAYFEHQCRRDSGLTQGSPSAELLNAHTRAGAYGTLGMPFFSSLGGGA